MGKWTKGPWSVGKRGKGGCYARINAQPEDKGHYWEGLAKVVVRMEDEGEDYPEGVANANLIAAAPDFAKASAELDRLSLIIESAVRTSDNAENHKSVVEAIRANRAALAKANG